MLLRTALACAGLFVLAALAVPAAYAASGDAVMKRVRDESRIHKNLTAEVRLVIRDKSGATKDRRFTLAHKILPERTKSLIKFLEPANVRRVGLLSETLEAVNETNQWLFLPALPPPRKLSATERHQSFMGSDLTNADMAGRRLDEDRHELISDDGKTAVVRSVPKDAADPYGRIETHVLLAYNVPSHIVFYDRRGRKLKTIRNQAISVVEGMHTPVRALVSNHRTGGSTELHKNGIRVDRELAVQEVGIAALRR